ncbi:hypothetical protein DB30_07363 [Enhygromyxa salina]|uniref:Type IV fimbrial biogenesis protein PilY1 n=1 Tax=Enhygromyxa salina TaxID=215803 RepID=A0A0C2D1B5_9BACT|nr:hypothetical protein [Enhygromyxa salina]KIG13947.1 hypothetical protein DB30_07363 [Enhygromyxa salina]
MRKQHDQLSQRSALLTWGLKLAGAALLLVGMLSHAQQAQARLDPFYIVTGASYGTVSPRILFVLDNSGSMAMDVTYNPLSIYPNTKCWWHNCEDDDAGVLQSRVNAAREVITKLAQANKSKAEFGLMTFGTALPPDGSNKAQVPDPCVARVNAGPLVKNQEYRFTWVKNVNQPYSNQWKPNRNAFGTQGIWLLCGDNRPFPYLRHDELGGFAMPNNSVEPLPDMPLYLAQSNVAAYESAANYSRRVQWFPRFVGRRANLDCSDPIKEAIVLNTHGDFSGNNAAQKKANICDKDFYYWPYVDGNPGYSFYDGLSEDNMAHQECTDNAVCKTETDQVHRLGIARRDQWVGASLYAPFYSKAVIDDPNIASEDKGPRSLADAWVMFDGITAKSYAGGADVTGGTPMAVAMGVMEYLVHLDQNDNITGPKPALPMTNKPFGHDTIASYLAFMRVSEEDAMCRPVTMIIVSDGVPDPWNKQGGAKLYERLRSIRRLLGVKTYMVAFTEEVYSNPINHERVHEIACAAAGGDSIPTPCSGGNDFAHWDTCANPDDPANGCAWLSENQDDLEATLTQIISKSLEIEVPGGSPTLANDFQLADPNNPESAQAAVQTSISTWTETPAWVGHVARGACNDEDPNNPGQLADYCANAADVPVETAELESFGPCPISRVWDAGECLQQTNWNDRRIYTHDFNNNVFRVADPDGSPSGPFVALVEQLNAQGRIDPPLSNNGDEKTAQIVAMTEWLLGRNMPNNWKLSGLPNSAPILIRRIPQANADFRPSVGIRDPHCAGRRNAVGDDVPATLEAFSAQAWEVTSGGGLDDHYDYTEAVLFGDDFGILHGVHYDSGNELFGFVPLALINNARKLSVVGPASYGQSEQISEHVFGVASTVNNGWAWDEQASKWRHLAVFGLGPGGSKILTLDVSHMGRLETDDPIEVVWTTSTTDNAVDFANTLGETWARPALTYASPNHEMSVEPVAYLVFGSGYREGQGAAERGRTVWVVDAITGETVTKKAFMGVPAANTTYDVADDYAAIADIAVGSHCLSRYWGEMQEAYWADPAGRLYRWDLATDVSNVTQFAHAADSGGAVWPLNPQGFSLATEGFRFPACQGLGEFSCAINPIGVGGSKGDVFTFSPAVVANNRIDEINNPGTILPIGDRDQFLLALVSGSPNDNKIDGGDDANDFHSSLYLIADDHRVDQHGGFDIPANAPATAPGAHAHFMRMPLNQIERTRTIVFPNGDTEDETRNFSKAARPIRAPMVRVTGLANGTQQLDAEVYYISYTIYEPGSGSCDSRWFDEEAGEWVADPGATYEISFRLVVAGGSPFDFMGGYQLPEDFNDGFGTSGNLTAPIVEQAICEGDNCGAVLRAPKTSPCDPNVDAPPIGGAISVQTGWAELEGFSPLETII